MQAWYAPRFEREMGLTDSEFKRCLPEAFEPAVLQASNDTPGSVSIPLGSGVARVSWRALPPRTIALMRMPRVHVSFDFAEIEDAERQRVLQRFDLVMLRGGG